MRYLREREILIDERGAATILVEVAMPTSGRRRESIRQCRPNRSDRNFSAEGTRSGNQHGCVAAITMGFEVDTAPPGDVIVRAWG